MKQDWGKIPDGIYHLTEKKKGFGEVKATMRVEDGTFIVQQGSICAPVRDGWVPEARRSAPIKDNVLQADVSCNSPSTAGWIVMGHANNGWKLWKNKDNKTIDIYQK